MKTTLLMGCVALSFAALVVAQTKATPPQQRSTGASAAPKSPTAQTVPAPVAGAASAAAQRALLDQYCVTCHNDRTKRANLSLEKLDLATHVSTNPEFWEKVVRKLRAGVMPAPPSFSRSRREPFRARSADRFLPCVGYCCTPRSAAARCV